MPKQSLHNAVVVITGASSGIGQAAALAFAGHGARLALAARNQCGLEQVAAACHQRGAQASAVETDVTDAEAVRQLAQTACDQLGGRIDVWINNAGVGAIGSFTETPIESHDQVIRTNLMGYLHGAHAVLPYFQRQGRGVLINTNSLGGWVPAPYAAAYTASKFGLRGFSEALRGELNRWPEIHICDIFPAFIDTPGLHHAANYAGKEVKPLPPLYDPELVARAMVALAQSPRDKVAVGQSATVARAAHFLFPKFLGKAMERITTAHFARAPRVTTSDGNLFDPPTDEPEIHGHWEKSKPVATPAVIAASLLAGFALTTYLHRKR
jgi:short-subunit dehydrogenase